MKKSNFVPEDIFFLKFLKSAKLSPDGRTVVYCLSYLDPSKCIEINTLYLLDLESGVEKKLTSDLFQNFDPDWSPDGKQIAFLSDRSGANQIHIITVDGGEAMQLTFIENGVTQGPKWSPDGKDIAFTARPKNNAIENNQNPYRINRHIYRFDSLGYIHVAVQNIFLISIDGNNLRQLTFDDCVNQDLSWSPNGKEIMYTGAFISDTCSYYQFPIRVVSKEGEMRDVLNNFGFIMAKTWSADSNEILFHCPNSNLPIGTKSDLWKINRLGGSPICLTETLEFGVSMGLQGDAPVQSDYSKILTSSNGDTAFFEVGIGGTNQIYQVSLVGQKRIKNIFGEECNAILLDIAEDKILFQVSTFDTPPDLFLYDLNRNQIRQLTQFNADFLAQKNLPTVEHFLFKSFDNENLEGWLMHPPGKLAPYPTILYIHGGPEIAFGNTFSFDFHILSGAGFGVLFLNHRGSTGYGSEFCTKINGDWGNLDYKDLMAGVDYVIAQGLANSDKLGVCGISDGGRLTCWIIGQTNRFKAAVPENPISDLISFYGLSDIGVWYLSQKMGGHPHEVYEVYRRCSPISFAHNCQTPTLLVQGESDYRCNVEQSEQFYTVLKANGCVVEMLRLPSSSHGDTIRGAVQNRLAQNEALLNWMKEYVSV